VPLGDGTALGRQVIGLPGTGLPSAGALPSVAAWGRATNCEPPLALCLSGRVRSDRPRIESGADAALRRLPAGGLWPGHFRRDTRAAARLRRAARARPGANEAEGLRLCRRGCGRGAFDARQRLGLRPLAPRAAHASGCLATRSVDRGAGDLPARTADAGAGRRSRDHPSEGRSCRRTAAAESPTTPPTRYSGRAFPSHRTRT
jgi:hypothetical protein